jgi:nucleoid DNA-binding protein
MCDMAKTPVTPTSDTSDKSSDSPPESPSLTAARKAAQAAAIAEAYAAPVPASPVPPASAGKRAKVAAEERGEAEGEELKLKELIEAAVAARGLKKSDAKPAIEAAMEVLGAALAEGRDVNLPGLGKMKIKRSKTTEGRRVIEMRLRQNM